MMTGANTDAIEVLRIGATSPTCARMRELAQRQQASGDLEARARRSRARSRSSPTTRRCASSSRAVLDAVADAVGAAGQRALAARSRAARRAAAVDGTPHGGQRRLRRDDRELRRGRPQASRRPQR
jgi:hypothetical protein